MGRPKKETAVKQEARGAVLEKDENGAVAWRKLLKPKHLLLNRHKFADIGINVDALPQDEADKLKTECGPEFLMISLNGFRELAKMRGLASYLVDSVYNTPESSVARVTLNFLPNDEEPNGVTWQGIGNATLENVNFNFTSFLPTLAENRGFIRALRAYTQIEVLGWEEVRTDGEVKIKSVPIPQNTLEQKIQQLGISFEELKDKIPESKLEWKGEWKIVSDLPAAACFTIINILSSDS